jgi:hypothetical protein
MIINVFSTPTGKEERAVYSWAIRDEEHQGGNNVACRAVSMQWFVKHVHAATDTHTTIELLLETGFFYGGPCGGVTRKAAGATKSVLYGKL